MYLSVIVFVISLMISITTINSYGWNKKAIGIHAVLIVAIALSSASDYNAINEAIHMELEEAVESAVETGYFKDSDIARLEHKIRDEIGQTVTIEGTNIREKGDEIYIRAQTKSKSFYTTKSIN